MNKYKVWALLVTVTVNVHMTMSAMMQQEYGVIPIEEKEEEDKKESSSLYNRAGDFAYSAADSIMKRVKKVFGDEGGFVQIYENHRNGIHYKPVYRLEGNCELANKKEEVPEVTRIGRFVNCATGRIDNQYFDHYAFECGKKGAMEREIRIYLASLNAEGKIHGVCHLSVMPRFIYDTLLYPRLQGEGLTNRRGDALVTDKQGTPLMYNGALIFSDVLRGSYVDAYGNHLNLTDEDGNRRELTNEDVQKLPTIDTVFRPNMAVGGVLAGTGVTLMGVGALVCKFVKLGHKKLFGRGKDNSMSEAEREQETVKQDSHEQTKQTEQATISAHNSTGDTQIKVEPVKEGESQKEPAQSTQAVVKHDKMQRPEKAHIAYIKLPKRDAI